MAGLVCVCVFVCVCVCVKEYFSEVGSDRIKKRGSEEVGDGMGTSACVRDLVARIVRLHV